MVAQGIGLKEKKKNWRKSRQIESQSMCLIKIIVYKVFEKEKFFAIGELRETEQRRCPGE